MKYLSVIILYVLSWTPSGSGSNSMNKMHIIIPFNSSPSNNSLCMRLQPTRTLYDTWNCTVSTLNELIDYNEDEPKKKGRASSTVRIY